MELNHNVQEDLSYGHRPVLLAECLEALHIRPDGVYVDGTLGRAGHSLEIAKRLTTGRLIGIDRDETAIAAAQERLRDYMDHVTLVHSNFDRIGEILEELNIPGADGMLFDLGVSSPQLDDAQRGFSYMHDAPLDMRMDRTAALDARQVVNQWSYEDLRRILYDFGEERYAPAIAKGICRAREAAPIGTTLQLVDVIKSAMPPQALRARGFSASSASPDTMGLRLTRRIFGFLPQTQTGNSGGQVQPVASSCMVFLMMRSSSEWKEITASRPPGFRCSVAASSMGGRASSSPLTAMRMA